MPPTNNSHSSDKPSILKDTREAKGLTLELVHEATKVPLDALKAIEEGYSSRILSPFYYRGFIKIYSEFLGLDVQEIYKQYGIDQPFKPAVSAPPVRKQGASAPAQPNVFLEQFQEGVGWVFKPKNLQLAGKFIGFLVLLFAVVKMVGCAASHLHQKPGAKKAAVHRKVQEAAAVPAAAAPAPARHELVAAQSQGDRVEVAVRASKDTWLRVRADDRVVYETTLSKGSLESWTAHNRIELAGRNLEQLDMEINSKHVGFLGGGERRIRRVIITKEGLTVKK